MASLLLSLGSNTVSCLPYPAAYTDQSPSMWQETTNQEERILEVGSCSQLFGDSSNYYLFLVFICVETEALAKVVSKPRETVTN